MKLQAPEHIVMSPGDPSFRSFGPFDSAQGYPVQWCRRSDRSADYTAGRAGDLVLDSATRPLLCGGGE